MANVKPIKLGKTERMSFAHIDEVLEMPNLIEVQKNSYRWFLEEGLKEVFDDISYISDHTGNLMLEFVDYRFDKTTKYEVTECKERDATYAVPLRVTVRLKNLETGEVKEQEVFMGDFPLMTKSGTFVINGAERVIVSQLVRSPGVYYSSEYDKTGKKKFASTVIPNRGAWLEYETDSNDIFYVRIDKNRKIPITVLIRALLRIDDNYSVNGPLTNDIGSDQEILEIFGEDTRIIQTMQEKDGTKNGDDALLEVYRKLRPGEPPTLDSSVTHLRNLLFDDRRYDLSKVGRYKYNKKLAIGGRISGHTLAEPVIDTLTGEMLAEAGETLTYKKAMEIERAGVDTVYLDVEGETVKIISNGMVDLADFVSFSPEQCGVHEKVRFSVLKRLMEECDSEENLKEAVCENLTNLVPKHIIKDDIFATINYINNLAHGWNY